MRVRQVKSTFTSGEVSRRLLGRGDLRAYENGALALRNVFIQPTGGVTRRAGLRYVDSLPSTGRLLSFEFNTEQTFLLALTDEQIDVFADGIKVETLSSPWMETDIPHVASTQSADTLLMVHPDHPPQKLTRSAGGVWALQEWSFFTDANVVHQP